MPLLKRKAFEKSKVSEYLRDDDEVFHCEVTDEIFKDYEEYCERIILVNSMVWSCEMTGKNNLTYSEALDSEKAAIKSLKKFPLELQIPILYLANSMKRTSFAEISENTFNFVRNRYFVGETVEACLDGGLWHEAHILSVTAPKQIPGSKEILPPESFIYEVEKLDDLDPTANANFVTISHDRIRRPKGVYSRDKGRLYLKQFVQMGPEGICIKKNAIDKYNINKISFNQIFTGDPPDFSLTKKQNKSPTNNKSLTKPNKSLNKSGKKETPDKKGRQESIDKFLKKTDDPVARQKNAEHLEQIRRAEDKSRQLKEEEKQKKKEKNARLQAYLKEWQKVKDDLDLEDHKIIPKGTPINVGNLPNKHFGDFLSVLEFVHIHGEHLKVKDVFHNGLDLETLRSALTLKEHAGVFSDLIQMLLTAIFTLQEDEAEEYNKSGRIEEFNENQSADATGGTANVVELATKASKWSQTYLGTPLSKLPLDPTTVSEVLRLHILSSGASGGSGCLTWRHQQRGGFSAHDDAGLRLRRVRPQLLQALRTTHVAALPIEDKFQILHCLINQILSYATIRDVIEEKCEDQRLKKHALRMLQINERKREAMLQTTRVELKKSFTSKKEELKLVGEKARLQEEELKVAIDKLMKDGEKMKKEFLDKQREMQIDLFDYASYLGSDRAFRRYWLNQNVAGVFVEWGDENFGVCRDKPLPLPPPKDQDVLAYVTKLFESELEKSGSDKENDSGVNSLGNSPKKTLSHLNGIAPKLEPFDSIAEELSICTGDISTCTVHGKCESRPQWWVYHTEEQIEALIQSLNKRGLREGELRQSLIFDKQNILQYITKAPIYLLNPQVQQVPPLHHMNRRHKFQPSLTVPPESSVSEALELSLRDHILELEEKIFHGCLGVIKVKDREAWRGTVMLRGYDKQEEFLSWGPNKQYRDDYHLPNGVLKQPIETDDPELKVAENKYRDPGHYLEAPKSNGVKLEPKSSEEGDAPDVVRALASALLQVSQAIHQKYLKRPLGLDDKERKEREAKNKPLDFDALERWEVSLMESRSFAQIVLHLFTLDSSVTWSASILNASCRLCRRKADPDNMLLCDGCNKGHHLYCLKPKLTKVPVGDWFCETCKPKEKTPRKRRVLFTEIEVLEDMNSASESEADAFDVGVCGKCGSGGKLSATCSACGAAYHPECAEPRPARQARRWQCASCLHPTREQSTRRCAAAAINNIHHYARAIDSRRTSNESYDSDDNTALLKLKGRRPRGSKEPSPINGHATNRRSKDNFPSKSGRKSKSSLNGTIEEAKTAGRRRGRPVQQLHPEALQTLLTDISKHKDGWPFCDPVNIEDVPDYLSVIEQPMDFGTIQQKLDELQYETDAQVIADAALVLTNCFTYNKDTHQIARAGVRLEKYIKKRCAELDLPILPEIVVESEDRPRVNKRRSPSEESDDAPLSKKNKLK